MGIPYVEVRDTVHVCMFTNLFMNLLIQAPCEAEAQCAAMAKAGKVYATATEDMDALTFGSTVVLRHLTASEQKFEIYERM